MTTFTVDPESLKSMGLDLLATADDLGAMEPRSGRIPEPGSDAVRRALDGFLGHWSDGTARISEQLGDLGLGLLQAASAYAGTDRDIVGAAQSLGRPATPQSAAPGTTVQSTIPANQLQP